MKQVFLLVNAIVMGLFLSACSTSSVKSNAAQTNNEQMRTVASKTQRLSGDAAGAFIEKYFPNADIPGSVEGSFNYTINKKTGYAKCNYPAMGGRSDGAVPTCEVRADGKTSTLKGDDAIVFIDMYFPNADIPGAVEGKYKYGGTVKKGFAKCNYPAMGGRSDGAVPTCEVQY